MLDIFIEVIERFGIAGYFLAISLFIYAIILIIAFPLALGMLIYSLIFKNWKIWRNWKYVGYAALVGLIIRIIGIYLLKA
ncbi:MAG: hypothetical protein WC843_06495 [Candidatus Gracilibacteria bacterium]|jgi:hypothetical protein